MEGGVGHCFFKREMERLGLRLDAQSKIAPLSLLPEHQNGVDDGDTSKGQDGVRGGDVIEFGEPTFSFGSENFGSAEFCFAIGVLYSITISM